MTTSFLPQINNGNGTTTSGMPPIETGMGRAPGLANGERTRNHYQAKTGSTNPLRSASIADVLSPREMIKQLTKTGTHEFGIEGYYLPKTESPKKPQRVTIPKNKLPGIIEATAKKMKAVPGAGAYNIVSAKPWNEQKTPRQVKPDFSKSPRKTEADRLEELNAIPEKSTPSPNNYRPNKLVTMPNLGRGAGSLLAR